MRPLLHAWIVVLLAVAATTPALASDFIVTEYTDDPLAQEPGCTVDHCTLREAVIAANAGTDLDRILLSAGIYAISLVGSNENLAADGDLDITRDLEIVGVAAGMTLLDATGLGEPAITANAPGLDFTLRNVTLRNSSDTGLQLSTGIHTIEDCEIRSNNVGIFASITSDTTLRRVTVVGNTFQGVSAVQSSMTVENSTLSGNGQQELNVTLMVAFSCSHCTIADAAAGDSEVTVANSTISFANSIVAGECSFSAGGAISSLGGNVESPGNTCSFGLGTDKNSKTSLELDLAALADNGGPTFTHLPGASSAVTGSADDTLCLLVSDQRGVVRVSDCESGSVERTGDAVATPIFIDGFLQGDPEAWSAAVS